MSDDLLNVNNVSKSYFKYHNGLQRFLSWLGFEGRETSKHQVINDVSFSLKSGEAVALIGENGAGKSTLLKLVTGTTQPTSGSIGVAGRVSAILELGLGFNPDMTGRQNVFLAAGVSGIPSEVIEPLVESIKEFSELEDYFDEPVRTFSSGMQARLAFSVATAIRPELLIVDEVLSVGDSYFQHKSFDKIKQFKEQGTSILFVTHSMSDVKALCDRVIMLDKGIVLKDGAPDEVVDFYNAVMSAKANKKLTLEQKRNKDGWLHTRSGTYEVVTESMKLSDATTGESINTLTVGQTVKLDLNAVSNTEIPVLVLGFMIRDKAGHVVWGTNTWHTKQLIRNVKPGEKIHFQLTIVSTLGPGSYSISPALTSTDTHLVNNYEWQDNAIVFDVVNLNKTYFIGSSWLDTKFEIDRTQS